MLDELLKIEARIEAEDLIHDWFDDRFMDGQFEECNLILPIIASSNLSYELCLTVFAVTFPARDELSLRPAFGRHVRELLIQNLKDEKRVNAILRYLDA